MTFKVYFNGVAREHFLNAASWYLEENVKLVDRLEEDIDRTIRFIAQNPRIYPIVYKDIRMAVLKSFPYNLYYRIQNGEVAIIALLHHKQNKDRIIGELSD